MQNSTKFIFCILILLVVYVGLLSVGLGAFYLANNKRPVQGQSTHLVKSGETSRIHQERHGDINSRRRHDDAESFTRSSSNSTGSSPSWFKFPGLHLHISSAFLDTRYNERWVRLLAIQHHTVKVSLNCLFHGEHTSEASAINIHPEWPPDKFYMAVLYSCSAPPWFVRSVDVVVEGATDAGIKIPLTVSVTAPPEAVSGDKMAVCIKAASGRLDVSATIEFLEFYRLLGVDSFIIYNSSIVGVDVSRILQLYSSMDLVHIVQFPLQHLLYQTAQKQHRMSKADDYSIIQQSYLLSINDCIYRFMQTYNYLLVVDLDEILTPFNEESLPFLLQKITKTFPEAAAYTFRTSWYFGDLNKALNSTPLEADLKLVNRFYRTPVVYSQPKAVITTANALTVNWHGAVLTHPGLGQIHKNLKVPQDGNAGAYVHHFRARCVDKFENARCEEMKGTLIKDRVLPRYITRLKRRVRKMKEVIKIIGK